MVDDPLRILIVEDEPAHAEAIRRSFQAADLNAEVLLAGTLREYREITVGRPPDIALLDLNLPDGRAVEVLTSPAEAGPFPVLIMTSYGNEQIAVEAMKAGALDYIVKSPEAFGAMPRMVERALREWRLRQERKQADEALRLSLERYRQLVENANEAIVVIQGDRFKFVNSMACEKTGYSEDELAAIPFPDLIHPDDRDLVMERYGQRLQGNDYPARYSFRVQTKNGIVKWVESSTVLIDWDVRPATLNFLSDITERKRAEEALRESEEKYRNLFEDAIEGIFQSTPEGRFITANPALARIYGFSSPEEMIGSIDDMAGQVYADPEDRLAFTRAMEENNEVKGYELRLKRKDGSGLWVSINARAVRDGTGKVLYYEGQSEDITPRKLSEEKLRETLESLRKAVGTTIQVMVSAVETRDPYTAGHQKRVTDLARTVAQELGLAQETIEGIRMAGSIHDLGKISVPAEILSKPTTLSEIEFALIQAHSQYGYEILKNVESPWPLADIVLQHHERMDGSGYPQGLKGEAILLEARILAVADVVESFASHRPYRPGHGLAAALEEIEQKAGVLYDRRVVEACLRLFREKGFVFE